ncbi:MAG: putative nucleotide-diphospho-sugar transferase [Chitinophagaceae bacterium]
MFEDFKWTEETHSCTEVFNSLDGLLNFDELFKAIKRFKKNENIIITFLSKELLGTGSIWLSRIHRLGIKSYIVFAVDIETSTYLKKLNISNCSIRLKDFSQENTNYRSKTGFTKRGLSIIALKYPIVKLLLELNLNVILSDVDAIIIKPLPYEYFENYDIAFQRVLYLPKPLVQVWGFAACTGFVWFKSSDIIINIVKNCIEIQKEIYSDQVALNLALWEENPVWNAPYTVEFKNVKQEFNEIRSFFTNQSFRNIDGLSHVSEIKIMALSPDVFWRNSVVTLDWEKVIIFHPNSPKSDIEKLETFKKYGL